MMTTKLLPITLMFLSLFACNSDKEGKVLAEVEEGTAETVVKEITDSKGYKLMEEKCFICHFAKPDPSRKSEMVAPPMLRVQEHYKPTYANKTKFVAAITEWVNNPTKAKTLMPGAVRKFKLMAKLPCEAEELKLIAEVLYDVDFGGMPNMHKTKKDSLQLDDGKKWKLKAAHIKQVKSVTKRLEKFKSDDLAAYIQLGRNVFNSAKTLLLDESYSDDTFEELHTFFNGVEGHIHLLIAAQSTTKAQEQLDVLKVKFKEFDTYFE